MSVASIAPGVGCCGSCENGMTELAVHEEIDRATKALDVSAAAVALEDVEAMSGLYSLTARSPEALDELGLRAHPDQKPLVGLLYVGKAESSLANRLVGTHFASGKTGWSTVRRTFAATLGVVSTTRPTHVAHPTPRQLMIMSANYGLQERNEAELTEWMRDHLKLRCVTSRWTPLKEVRASRGRGSGAATRSGASPMWEPNPWHAEVGAARDRMRQQVRHQLGLI